ncbi:hypothetical protein G9A89_009095 [Geosiphon pyriformis]|nr:hypothetical protein G9A89_009095 [Geosiphon pyriformis]
MTASDITTLEYYQSIYTHCKQLFEIRDGIIAFKKTLFQYIENRINDYLFGNYNITTVKRDLLKNILHYSNTESEKISAEACATYFEELDYNIIQFCEEKYPANVQFVFELESEPKTSSNKRQRDNRPVHTTPNTSKISFKHLQTPKQGTSSKLPLTITPFSASLAQSQTPNSLLNQFTRPKDFILLRSLTRQQEPLQTSSNLLDFLAENQSKHSETTVNKENEPEISEEKSIDSKDEEDEMTTYITKIPEFNGKDIETRTAGEWFENLAVPFNDWNVFKAAFLEQFTDNNTSITLRNRFQNIKQEPSESVMTYIGKFNKLLRRIHQLKTNDYYSDAQILDQFITGLKNKLIKKVYSHVPEDLNSAIQHAKRYKMAMEEANRTKLVNLAIGETSSAAEEKLTNSQRRLKTISPINNNSNPKDEIKITLHHFPITSLRIAITVKSLATGKEIAESYNETNKIGVINITLHYSNLIINRHHQLTIHQDPNIKITIITIPTTIHTTLSTNNNRISSNNQLVPQNTTQPRPNSYHTQPSYLTMPEEQDFYHTALSEGRAAAQQQNPSYTPTTIPPARIAENANLSDIFPFEFEANESPFLLSNAAANEQKAITAMYTEAEVEGKTIRLILDSRSAGSIITYQLIQQLKKNTPVGEIDNFPFILDGITIPVKVLVIDVPQYQALVGNDWLQKANANLNWKTQELTISYQGQHAWVPAICGTFNKYSEKALAFEFKLEEEKPLIETFMALESTSNWADETEQEHFTPHTKPKTSGWNIPYSKPEPRKQCPYIPLKCKDCHKKLSSIGACISPEEEYENHTCYYCKAYHRE